MSDLPTRGWETQDERVFCALHRDQGAANNYVTKPFVHGTLHRLVRDDEVDKMVASIIEASRQAKDGEP